MTVSRASTPFSKYTSSSCALEASASELPPGPTVCSLASEAQVATEWLDREIGVRNALPLSPWETSDSKSQHRPSGLLLLVIVTSDLET